MNADAHTGLAERQSDDASNSGSRTGDKRNATI